LELDRPGGSLLMLTVVGPDRIFRIPFFAQVENVDRVLDGIELILADRPDPEAAQRLARLRTRTRQWSTPSESSATDHWRQLFDQANRLRDQLLLQRINFDTLLFVKRKPYFSEQPFMDAHHLFNRPGGGIYRLSPVRPDGKVTPVVDGLGEGLYRDVTLHWNAERFLFAFGNGSDKWDGSQSYHIYQAPIDGSSPRRLTSGPRNDCEAFYLADGKIGFTSDRSDFFVMCGGDRHAPTLFVMEADGSNPRQLSFNVFNDFNPAMLPDGRILYSRWEYNERSVTSLHNPFTMNPDGTMVSPYYGNATIRPNVVMFPRPVPNSRKVMALFTAHHGQTHGAIGLIDVRRGMDGREPLEVLTPGVPISGEKVEDSLVGWYSDPVPLSESTYLCSYTPTIQPWLERSWALYVGDRHGNLALVYRDPEISCAEPVPLVPRRQPHVREPASVDTDSSSSEATLILADVYVGLPNVERGAARYLRILEDLPRKGVTTGGVIVTSGTLIFTVKRILGTVPIEPDGSAHFMVPANRNVYFEVLDADGREIQRMRSVLCLKPGEVRGCIGCHERRTMAPPDVMPAAFCRSPNRPDPPPWGTRVISFLRDVQPTLNTHCVKCHTHNRIDNRVILTDDLTDQFNVAYEELLPYLSVAISNRWDNPDDVHARPPYTFGSKVSPLSRLLDGGHHGVELSAEDWQRLAGWIDANGVYYDRYQHNRGPKRKIFTGPVRQALDQVFNRRCVECHARKDGRFGPWWMSINRRDVSKSRALAAPLALAAGGWGRCQPTVFADTSDPGYQSLLSALTALAGSLKENPRVDLISISGTEAASQAVELPPPPEPRITFEALSD
jgi:hydrazine synthase alpha subunit-like protein